MTGHEPLPDGVSITEAARVLGTSRPTLSKLLSEADFPRRKARGKTLVSLAQVREFYEAHKAGFEPKNVGQGASVAAQPRPQQADPTSLELELARLSEQVRGHEALIADLAQRSAAARLPEPSPKASLSLWGVLRQMLSPWGRF